MQTSRAVPQYLLHIVIVLIAALIVPSSASAQQTSAKTRLSQALRAALAKEAPAAVEKRFTAELKTGSHDYEVDAQGVNTLAIEYMQKGDMERGQAVMAVSVLLAQAMAAEMIPPEMTKAMAEAEAKEQRERAARRWAPNEEERARQRSLDRLGPPRDDLERFHGLYGEPGGDPHRTVFIIRNCDGHLRVGASWGDVAPYVMRSAGETKFEHPGDDFNKPVHIEFAVDADGKATRITHDLTFIGSPLTRVGDLPADWLPRCEDRG